MADKNRTAAQSLLKKKIKGRVIFVLGPTASGKTDLSFWLAAQLSAGILNCDSIQMYKGMDIGSAKPKLKKNCFLFSEWEPPFVCTAGEFRKKALPVLKKELPRRAVIAVGGSGFYIQALEKGMLPVKKVQPEITTLVQQIQNKHGWPHLYKLLKMWDPLSADTISPNDHYRLFRAVSLILSEKRPLSLIQHSFQKKPNTLPYPIIKIGLHYPKDELLERVRLRTHTMLKNGLLQETQKLVQKTSPKWPLLKSVGYKECLLFLNQKILKEELPQRIIQRTMRLAKKQMMWFKRDKNIHWFHPASAAQTKNKQTKNAQNKLYKDIYNLVLKQEGQAFDE